MNYDNGEVKISNEDKQLKNLIKENERLRKESNSRSQIFDNLSNILDIC